MFPDACLQSAVGSDKWWVKNETNKLCRGALVYAFAPHVDQLPYELELVARRDATNHDSAVFKVAPFRMDRVRSRPPLPVAAMPLNEGELWAAYRAKRRPCLVIGCNHPPVDPALTRGMPKHATAPTCLVAPYYGVAKTASRAGYRPEFVERVQQCEYPQFVWDVLPIPNGEASILRLDHLQPVGAHYTAYKLTGYRLGDGAIEVIDEMIGWLMEGGVEEDSLVALYRQEIEAQFPD